MIELRDVTRSFGDVRAVDGVSFTAKPGEIFGLIGPNGAGKSTTIRMLCGLLRPTAGSITIAGYDIAREPLEVKRSIGVLLEETHLYDRLTGREFLLFAAQMYGMPAAEAGRRGEGARLDLGGEVLAQDADRDHPVRRFVRLAEALPVARRAAHPAR